MLGCKPIVHRRNGEASSRVKRLAQSVVLLCGAHHITAAMHPQQRGSGLADAGRPVQPHTDTGAQGQHLDAGRGFAALQAAQRPDDPEGPRADPSRGARRASLRRSG